MWGRPIFPFNCVGYAMELRIGIPGTMPEYPNRPKPWVTAYFLVKWISKGAIIDPLGDYPAFTLAFKWCWRREIYGKLLYPGRRWLEAHGEA